jgi:cysteine desulfurase/selenocysteine lyase
MEMHRLTPVHPERQPDRADATDPLRGFGGCDGFPITAERIYTNICDSTVLSRPVREAVDRFLDQVMYWREPRSVRDVVVEAAKAKFATLIGAGEATEIAIVKNVSEGINAVATAFDWRPGDNVVVCASLEHPNNVIPWLHLRRLGVEVRAVPPLDGAIDPERMIAAINESTRVVTCSSVSFAPGLRTDLAAIGRACRERDVFFLVDAVQSAGILQLDVEAAAIDGLVASTAKGLLGLYGMGFLYCRREWAQRLTPAYLSRPAVDLPPERYSEMASFDLVIWPDARRFDVGAVDYASCYAADAALDLIFAAGPAAIESHALGLADRLRRGVADLGLEVTGFAGPRDRLSHIVTVGRLGHGGHEVTNDGHLAAISARLAEANVVHTIRRGMLRFGFHLFNTERDVDTILEHVAASSPRGRDRTAGEHTTQQRSSAERGDHR